jgi:glycosyltransferase involved in cell wall biosynthesis
LAKVSIIIPFYNCAYVDKAIESALNQTYQDKEVIVVNDGSTIHTEKITPYLDRIIYIQKENGGTASALNAGLRTATGKYFSWLSSDDMYLPYKVERQVQVLENLNACVSYMNYYLIDERGKVISQPAGIGFPLVSQFIHKMRRGCIINGCTVMVRMDVFDEFGFFDESLHYTQDYDFWLRILPKHAFHYISDPLVYYRVHGEMGTKKHRKSIPQEILQTKNRHRVSTNTAFKAAIEAEIRSGKLKS